MERCLVSCEWLRAELDLGAAAEGALRVVDATWYLANSPFGAPEGSKGPEGDFLVGPRLPGARFFDIDGVASKDPKGLPHMLPDEATFSAAMAALGIAPETRVVVYDRLGIFSAARLWYTLKVAFGHPGQVAVLDGGLPRWLELGFPVEMGPPHVEPPSAIAVWRRMPDTAWDMERMRANIDRQEALVLDARGKGRFEGTAPEPRAGCRSGHIPKSRNVPFTDLLTGGPTRTMRPVPELRERLLAAGVPLEALVKPGGGAVVTSCGSGLTACIVGLAMHQVGMPLESWSVYDGSWTDWGTDPDVPVVTGPAE